MVGYTEVGPLCADHSRLPGQRLVFAPERVPQLAVNGVTRLHPMWRIPTRSLCRMKSTNATFCPLTPMRTTSGNATPSARMFSNGYYASTSDPAQLSDMQSHS